MDRRVILTIVVSLVAMWAWLWVSQKLWPPPQAVAPASQPVAAKAGEGQRGAPASQAAGSQAAGPQAVGGASQPVAAQAQRSPEAVVDLVGKEGVKAKYRAAVSTWGAALRRFELLDPQYKEERAGRDVQIDLVRTASGPTQLPLRTVVKGKTLAVPEDAEYRVVKKEPGELALVHEGPAVRVQKRFKYDPATYLLDVSVEVTNTGGAKEDDLRTAVQLFGYQHPEDKGGGFFKPPRNLVSAACFVNGSLEREARDNLVQKPVNKQGDVRWVAIDEKYFLMAVMPLPASEPRGCGLEALPGDRMQAELRYPPRTLGPGQTETFPLVVYVGPKTVSVLDSLVVGGQDPRLGQAVDFGWFAFIARPLLFILKLFQSWVRNWGLAIILLTIFVKLITLYWTQKSMRSMQAMAKLKPKITALQEKYKDDKQRLNQEMMALYKAHGVNPLSGCLPMLLQMPIWIALYSTLQVSVELYRTPFVGWLTDLTAPDRYYVLPVATGLLMFVQQKISPSPQDNQQAKMMLYMMPIMFTAFTLFVPSGLTLYILTNTVLAMGHQIWMNRTNPVAAVAQETKSEAQKEKGAQRAKR